ncbi:ABC transporter ATP-binding protein [Sphaerisporangium sp. NPDC004334]
MRWIIASCVLVTRAVPGMLVLYIALTLAAGVLPVTTAWLTKSILDGLVGGGSVNAVIELTAGLAVAGVITAVLPQANQYLRAEMDRRVGLLSQNRLFTAVEGFIGIGNFENPYFLDRLRLAQQAGSMPNRVVDSVLGIFRGLITITGFLASLLLISPVMTFLLLLSGVPTLIAEIALSKRRAGMFWKIGPVERREFLYLELLSSVEAAKEIRLFGIGPLLRERMVRDRLTANAAKRALERREVTIQAGLGVLTSVIFAGGLFWAVGAAHAGQLTVGGITIFVAAVAGLQTGLATLARDVSVSHHGLLMFGHYMAVVTAPTDLPMAPAAPLLPPLRQGIELRNVWFRYSEAHPWVLRGVDLHIPYGKAMAIVGLNGSGKSTLIKLLCRFYDPVRGSILWDGVDIRDIDVGDLRKRIGAVFQDYMSYNMTAAENIGLGDVSLLRDRKRIEIAAKRAGIHGRLAELPHGYDTLLSRMFFMESEKEDPETGVVLSGGQWQRLALARGLLRDQPDLMILDEPSAGLDAQAEYEIHDSLREHRKGRTSILVSHRLGAVRDAGLIVVLRDGQIVERGDHATLMVRDGEYARLFALQAAGYHDSVATETTVAVRSGGSS